MTTTGDLVAAVVDTVRALPGDQIELMATALDRIDVPGLTTLQALYRFVPTEPYRAAIDRLHAAWQRSPETSGASVALALRAAHASHHSARSESQIDVVWTGPDGDVDVRLTYAVLIEVIRTAVRSLILVSFAAYRVREVVEALHQAANRGIEIRLILDGGTEAARAFEVSERIVHYTWPPTLLPEHDPGHASLHAKAAIADDRLAFVTSANLTEYALDRNMELGLLVRGGAVPKLLSHHFNDLIDRNVLVRA